MAITLLSASEVHLDFRVILIGVLFLAFFDDPDFRDTCGYYTAAPLEDEALTCHDGPGLRLRRGALEEIAVNNCVVYRDVLCKGESD